MSIIKFRVSTSFSPHALLGDRENLQAADENGDRENDIRKVTNYLISQEVSLNKLFQETSSQF